MTYLLLDCGNGKKLEQFSKYKVIRPCMQALWKPCDLSLWKSSDAIFSREGESQWNILHKLPSSWDILLGGAKFEVFPTSFGHMGIFPEHLFIIEKIKKMLCKNVPYKLLNLFGYTGLASILLAKEGVQVCHVDAAKPSIEQAKKNASINQISSHLIRWIIDDVMKFTTREIKRESFYDIILLDPPSFGRGPKKEVFKLEKDFLQLLQTCKKLLSKKALLLAVTCHTPGITPLVLQQLVEQVFPKGKIECSEMAIQGKQNIVLPSGVFALWSPN